MHTYVSVSLHIYFLMLFYPRNDYIELQGPFSKQYLTPKSHLNVKSHDHKKFKFTFSKYREYSICHYIIYSKKHQDFYITFLQMGIQLQSMYNKFTKGVKCFQEYYSDPPVIKNNHISFFSFYILEFLQSSKLL